MATSKSLESNDIHSCPICLDVLKSPKSLACLHTFCNTCIGEFIVATAQKQKTKISSYPCPVCKTLITPTNQKDDVSKWASLLPDTLIKPSRSKTCESNEKTEMSCDWCKIRQKSIKGSFWCRECNETLCGSCNETHSLIKALATHRVSSLDNEIANKLGIDVTAISITCSVHSPRLLEAYCFDHKELCCLLCVTQNHRKCENVKAIEDTEFKETNSAIDIKTALTSLQQTIENLILQRNKKLELLDESAKTSQAEASKVVACAKDKLDTLLIAFTKELTLLQDNEKFAIDEELGRLNELLKDTNHLVGVFNVVNEDGNTIQKFIHNEKAKSRIENDILPVLKDIFAHNEKVSLELHIDSILQKVASMKDIGKIQVFKSTDFDSEETVSAQKIIETLVTCLGINVMKVVLTSVLKFPGKTLVCGVSISSQVIICGDQKSGDTIAIDTTSGLEINSKECSHNELNGLAMDSMRKHIIYTSKDNKVICTNLEGGEIFQFEDKQALEKPTSVTVRSSGYILVGNEAGSVHAISPDGLMHFTVIENCQQISKLCDIWLDQSEQTLFLCGNEFIEMYHIDGF